MNKRKGYMIACLVGLISGISVGLIILSPSKDAQQAKEGRLLTVTETQTALVEAGYPLPIYGVDGIWGIESQYAMDRYQADWIAKKTFKAVTVNKEILNVR